MKTQKFLRMQNPLVCEYRLNEFQTFLIKENENLYNEKINNSKICEQLLRPFYEPYISVKEVFYVIFLNNQAKPIGIYKVSEGGIAGTSVDKRFIAKTAIDLLASSVIISHNHPSGNLKESPADIKITNEIHDALKLFDIILLDHIILTPHFYKSFSDEGLL